MYSLAIYLYMSCVAIASLFNKKARLMLRGQRDTYRILREKRLPGASYIWFHAASLGEFEQGRPLMERLHAQYPEYKILLTFFSPSGYEVRKDYEGADIVCYLPFDTALNARKFIRLAQPSKAFFIKYEFWQNYLNRLARLHIPTYSVSSIFRENQIFFRPYGRFYARALHCFDVLFVQNEHSCKLLSRLGITQTKVVGDTRFDRVLDIQKAAREVPVAAAFSKNRRVLVAGSTWAPDEDILASYFNRHPEQCLILAPHVVSEAHLAEIEKKIERPCVRLSKTTPEDAAHAECLIIDSYGLLSSLYRYGQLAYVGGGFGAGIHNVPEAAVYGVPVLIGPNNRKFREAQKLLECGGCIEIHDADSFAHAADRFLMNEQLRLKAGQAAENYIISHAGASDAIFQSIPW